MIAKRLRTLAAATAVGLLTLTGCGGAASEPSVDTRTAAPSAEPRTPVATLTEVRPGGASRR